MATLIDFGEMFVWYMQIAGTKKCMTLACRAQRGATCNPACEVLGLARVRGFGARVRGVLLGTLSIIVSVMAPPPIFYLKLWGVGAYLEIIGGST